MKLKYIQLVFVCLVSHAVSAQLNLNYSFNSNLTFELSLFGYEKLEKGDFQLFGNEAIIGIRDSKYSLAFEKASDSDSFPLAFCSKIGGEELYQGAVGDFFRRIILEMEFFTKDCTLLDLRYSRLLPVFSNLESIFPNLEILALSSKTLGGRSLSELKLPPNLRVLVLDGFCISKSLIDGVTPHESVEMLVLSNCWSDTIRVPPHMTNGHSHSISSFSEISGQIKYLLLFDSSEMILHDILISDWPRLRGIHLNITKDFLYGPHPWLDYFENSKIFPLLDSVFISLNYINAKRHSDKVLNSLKRNKSFSLKEENAQETRQRITSWIITAKKGD